MKQEAQHEVIIIGGGLAGLACAVVLCEAGKQVALLEATDRVGGRVRSDVVDGFTLDHGFQVLLTAYPACQRLLDYNTLRLRRFDPGARIRIGGRFTTLGDPWRKPSQAIATALNPVGSLGDKFRIATLRHRSRRGTLEDLYQRPSMTTLERLRAAGFSAVMIDRFFRPFLGGVFLDESLSVSSRMLEFVFRMFSAGDVAVPADGMAAIPRQLAQRLPRGVIHLQSSVAAIDGLTVRLTDSSVLRGSQIVVATESNAAARLLGMPQYQTPWNQTTTLYYAAPQAPDRHRSLILRGDETGPIQTATILSNVAPEYAPANRALISVSLGELDESLARDDLVAVDTAVRHQLRSWFSAGVETWDLLGVYQVPFGLPRLLLDPVELSVRASDAGGPADVFVCGDHRETPSIQGAMNSGLRVAEAILAGSRRAAT